MLIFHTVTQVGIQLANLVLFLLEELVATKDLCEVLIDFFYLRHSIEFGLNCELVQFCSVELFLEIIILFFEFFQ